MVVASVLLQHHCINGFSISRQFSLQGKHHNSGGNNNIISTISSTKMQNINQSISTTALYAKKQQPNKSSITRSNFLEEISDKDTDGGENKMFGIFKKSPGTLIIAPFVFLFGLDLILNILAITRRSLEFALTGEVHPLI